MSDRWDERARELYAKSDHFTVENGMVTTLEHRIAAALRAAYGRGVEDSAGAAQSWVDDVGNDGAMLTSMVEAIRALKEQNP